MTLKTTLDSLRNKMGGVIQTPNSGDFEDTRVMSDSVWGGDPQTSESKREAYRAYACAALVNRSPADADQTTKHMIALEDRYIERFGLDMIGQKR